METTTCGVMLTRGPSGEYVWSLVVPSDATPGFLDNAIAEAVRADRVIAAAVRAARELDWRLAEPIAGEFRDDYPCAEEG